MKVYFCSPFVARQLSLFLAEGWRLILWRNWTKWIRTGAWGGGENGGGSELLFWKQDDWEKVSILNIIILQCPFTTSLQNLVAGLIPSPDQPIWKDGQFKKQFATWLFVTVKPRVHSPAHSYVAFSPLKSW